MQTNLESFKGRIQSLMVNLYRQRSNRFARTLSQAQSFHELRVKNYYLSLLTEQDAALVKELNDTLAELQEAQTMLVQQLEERRTKEAQLKANEVELEDAKNKLEGIIAELQATHEGQLAQKQALLREQNAIEASLTDLGDKYQAEIARLREEEEQLRRQAAQAFLDQRERQRLLQEADQARTRIENLTTPLQPLSSGFIFPISGAVLISDYGDNNASFVALRADVPNAAVRSMQDGVVVQVALISANDGYLVAVQHSQDLVTAYTNLRRPLVAIGDRVAQGQVVGYLGGSSLLPNDILKLWVRISRNGQTSYIDPGRILGF